MIRLFLRHGELLVVRPQEPVAAEGPFREFHGRPLSEVKGLEGLRKRSADEPASTYTVFYREETVPLARAA